MKRLIVLVLVFCGSGCFTGCSGEKLPSDFPRVFPMTVTVKDGTTPLSEVKVMFYPATTGAGASFASSGTTDANGVAQMKTSQGGFSKAGVPVGEFVVTVEDIIDLNMGITAEERSKMSIGELNKLSQEQQKFRASYKRKVPTVLCATGKIENRSPIRYSASDGTNELTIDVAKYK